ncbi:hypothetical protein Tco_1553483 [Tanacetum coccineum]
MSPRRFVQFFSLAGTNRNSLKGFSKIAKPMTKHNPEVRLSLNGAISKKQHFQLLQQKLCQCTNPCLPEGKRRFHRILRRFKEGFGRCVDAKRKDALSRKEREPPLRVRALVMTISLDLPKMILNAQTEAQRVKTLGECWLKMLNFQKLLEKQQLEPRGWNPVPQWTLQNALGTNLDMRTSSIIHKQMEIASRRPSQTPREFCVLVQSTLERELKLEKLKYSELSRTDPITTEKSSDQQRMQAARVRQKELRADFETKPMKFKLGDKVMLKVTERVGEVAYKLELPETKSASISKVRWNSKRGPEFTWEREDQFKKKYPHLFTKTTPSQVLQLYLVLIDAENNTPRPHIPAPATPNLGVLTDWLSRAKKLSLDFIRNSHGQILGIWDHEYTVTSPYGGLISDIVFTMSPDDHEFLEATLHARGPRPEHDDDEIVAEDQLYAEDASPIVQSPDYIPESDPEPDPEEDGDEDPEEDPNRTTYGWKE